MMQSGVSDCATDGAAVATAAAAACTRPLEKHHVQIFLGNLPLHEYRETPQYSS